MRPECSDPTSRPVFCLTAPHDETNFPSLSACEAGIFAKYYARQPVLHRDAPRGSRRQPRFRPWPTPCSPAAGGRTGLGAEAERTRSRPCSASCRAADQVRPVCVPPRLGHEALDDELPEDEALEELAEGELQLDEDRDDEEAKDGAGGSQRDDACGGEGEEVMVRGSGRPPSKQEEERGARQASPPPKIPPVVLGRRRRLARLAPSLLPGGRRRA